MVALWQYQVGLSLISLFAVDKLVAANEANVGGVQLKS